MNMSTLLQQALAQKLLRPLDVQFARWLADDSQPAIMLAAALLSRDTGDGHVCLPLENLNPGACFNPSQQPLAQQLFSVAGWQDDWQSRLLTSPAISAGDNITPIKLSHQRLYLYRLWQYECCVAHFFQQQNQPVLLNESAVTAVLNQLFSSQNETDWQKIAVAVALTRRISIISGGPGTGKTTTVAKLLLALNQLHQGTTLRIRLAAPTGKAAARLTEALNNSMQKLPSSGALPGDACTLHRLLGVQQGSQRPRHHAANPLHLDVLIVDEASMIDLPMMARLINALPHQARLILLGDHEQLASVEAGAILGDLCHYAGAGYTPGRAAELTRLCGQQPKIDKKAPASQLRDGLCLLHKSHRFTQHSGIGQLAAAVNNGNIRQTLHLLSADYPDISLHPLRDTSDYQSMLADAIQGYQHYLQLLQQQAPPGQILQAFSQYQLLCALRDGPFGVNGVNQQLEKILQTRHLISRHSTSRWYHGRPIMISHNDSALGLYNGDTGIALQTDNGIRVWFSMPDGQPKPFSPGRLPEHNTAWSITVHKSQGSEFDHVALILPTTASPIITRELVYTAITRARQRLSLYTDPSGLTQAISHRTRRHSGLISRLA